MAAEPIRLLLAEDSAPDIEMELREIRRSGLRIEHRVADSEAAFTRELEAFAPHVILSDFSMPSFDGMEALRIARDLAPWTPFLFVSGTLGEDYAIRALKNGATDYVLKTNLVRLPAAIERAIAGAKERRARKSAEAGLARAQSMAKLAHVVTGPDGVFEARSESLPRLVGIEPDYFPASTREWLDLVHPDDRERFRARTRGAGADRKGFDIDYRLRREDGEWMHIRQVIEPLSAEAGADEQKWFSTLQDVSEQKRAENQIRRLNRVYAVLSGISSLIVRAGSRDALFGEACRIAVEHGRFPLAWIALVDKSGDRLEVIASAGAAAGYVDRLTLEVGSQPGTLEGMGSMAVRDKRAVIANDLVRDERIPAATRAVARERGFGSLTMLPLVVGERAIGVLALYSDQTGFFDSQEIRLLNELSGHIAFAVDHLDKAERLEYLSFYDPVTGLANRMLLLDRLGQTLASTAPGEQVALVLMDIERFKAINDAFGRPAGDALLGKVAERLVGLARHTNRVAHVGGDRFAVIVPGVRSPGRVARAIDEGFAAVEGEPFRLGDTELRLAIRSGIAFFPSDGTDGDALFKNAESALKKAKESGAKYLFYTQQLTERFAERLSLENRLRRAVEREEFVLHYQPKVTVAPRRIVGVEALIRWQSEEGLIPPASFIPLLEESGLIVQVGAWALRRATLDQQAWAAQGLSVPRIAVNVSPIQLRQPGFLDTVRQAVGDRAGRPAIDLEITETVIMEDIAANIEKLKHIRALGMDVAIDDFGTGYSSLGYLAQLPVQSLKIDRSFVAAMEKEPSAMTLVSTIISLAHSLHLKVVAEGVETERQAELLHLLQCDEMQGYLFSKPVPAAVLVDALRAP